MKNCAHVTKLGNKEGSRKGRKDREREGRIKKGKEGSRKGRKARDRERKRGTEKYINKLTNFSAISVTIALGSSFLI